MARLLDTKLRPPPLRGERVYRPRLYEDLADFTTGVVLVSAPPGFGKSTLVVEWLTRQNRRFAWYSLDRYDGDVGLFGEYVGAAIGSLIGSDSGLVPMPEVPTPDPRTLIASLVGDLTQAPTGAALVLDDYHEIESGEVHEAVTYLVENLPDGVMVVIVTRADPPLPLSRLRGRGRLREIRGAELRFAADHVAEYFRLVVGIELDTSLVAAHHGEIGGLDPRIAARRSRHRPRRPPKACPLVVRRAAPHRRLPRERGAGPPPPRHRPLPARKAPRSSASTIVCAAKQRA